MNLAKLFETQKVLRVRIGYEGPDRFEKLILALLVEVGECANEWRGFKFWSKDQEPRVFVPNPKDVCKECEGQGMLNTHLSISDPDREFCEKCDGCGVHFHNALLEEYVDGLHFILEIGLEKYDHHDTSLPIAVKRTMDSNIIKYPTVSKQFNKVFNEIGILEDSVTDHEFFDASDVEDSYVNVLRMYIGLGEMLGFTWEQIEQAYYDKNQVNHERQDSGY
ncbi:dUTP diphosphatase [Niallia taxi]|uniref:dUTP diphosphatase n=1 Tax=Niallia taxi TaxID=2499688 RepID=UPI00317FF1ED